MDPVPLPSCEQLAATLRTNITESNSFCNDTNPIEEGSLPSNSSIGSIFNLATVLDQLIFFRKFCSLNNTVNSTTKTVLALQLPDEFLWASKEIVSSLSQSLLESSEKHEEEFAFYILADTQYSACCVDEVAAEHVLANLIIHFGRSCLSKTHRLPVIFSFEMVPLDMNAFTSQIQALDLPILIIYDVCHSHLNWSNLQIPGKIEIAMIEKLLGENGIYEYIRTFPKEFSPLTVIYVGPNSPAVTRFACKYSATKFLHYDSTTDVCAVPISLYKKRYYMMNKAKEAQSIGIVVGTLGISNYLDLIHSLKSVIRKQRKKCYTFALGKLNVPKLANFSEIDIFVLVACPESSIIDSKEFFRPVVTPYEMIMALKDDAEWNGTYEFQFQSLLTGLEKVKIQTEDDPPEGAETEDSLITLSSALISRQVGEISMKRTWRGLEIHSNREKPMEIFKGRHGIASQYQDEPHNSVKR
ncbi:Diphthamide biosynthesis protein 2 [Coelomomyces lativittatus]|nr:Diphthamide biosynthesis protein 2 [Coelomomyces lativittatus]KAJ1513871.1 Diphthamide biosynthesis protein 2 [Coelomomyces lativittatus]KAJ1518608.1 Diphthamide biosynthesis protein 2 [Coelomomyces lativittatus]